MNKNIVKVTEIEITSKYYKFIAYLEKVILKYALDYKIDIPRGDVNKMVIITYASYVKNILDEYRKINNKFYNGLGNTFTVIDTYLAEVEND